jgi:hypothetical protein
VKYNVSVVFFFKKKVVILRESAWNASMIHLSLTASGKYLVNLTAD